MLWYCGFKWHPTTTAGQVGQRILAQHEAGANHPERIKGWYGFAGGGAGFLLIEADDPRDVTAFLTPYWNLMAFDVHSLTELDYATAIANMQRAQQPVATP